MQTTQPDIEEQLLSPEYVQSPYATYDLLRENFPVYWCRKWNAWLLTRYEDALVVLRDHETFSNQGRYTEYLSALSPAEREQLTYLRHHYEHGGLVQSDPPAHTRLRKLIGGAFTPRIVAHMQSIVEEIVEKLIDSFADDDKVELIYQFAFPLPAMVIAGILGVPAEERDMFKVWSSDVQSFLGSGTADFQLALKAQDAWRNMNEYFAELLAQRRREPRNDLVSTMAAAQEDGQRLSDDELVRTCGAMLIAGHETTTNLIASAIWLLLKHPRQRAMLDADASLYASAVEEVLRFEAPFQSVPRTITRELELDGTSMRRGQLAYVMIGAVNRDPQRFADPHRFDIRRTDNKHLSFGYGIHFCLGSALARMEAPIAIRRLLARLPNLSIAPPSGDRPSVIWKRSMVQRGMEAFHLRM